MTMREYDEKEIKKATNYLGVIKHEELFSQPSKDEIIDCNAVMNAGCKVPSLCEVKQTESIADLYDTYVGHGPQKKKTR